MISRRPVVVTGGAGFIGSHVVDRLLARDVAIVVVDDMSTGLASNLPPSVEIEHLDIADPNSEAAIARLRPRAIVHCAGQVSVRRSFQDPVRDARSNVIGTLHVIQAALQGPTDRFIYISSGGALYGDARSTPCAEDTPVAPLSPYGWSKWLAERYVALVAGDRLAWVSLRLANVYGPRQRSDGEAGVVAIFVNQMRRGLPVTIDGDGEQTRDFVFVDDVAEAVSTSLEGGPPSLVVNIGSGRATSVNRLFRELAGFAGYRQPPVHREPRRGDVRDSVLDVRLAGEALGWTAATALDVGLRATYSAGLASRG